MIGRTFPVMILALLGVAVAMPLRSSAEAPSGSKGMAALERTAKDNRYLFIYFWKNNDPQSQQLYRVFQGAMAKMSDRAEGVPINLGKREEQPVVKKFDVSRAPMPLVVAVAPNGAVTKGFPRKFDEIQLQTAFVSPCTEICLKAMQENKLVLLCVQNEKTRFSQIALQGAQAFKADARFTKATEVLTIDPNDRTEAAFLSNLKVSPQTPTAVTVLLAPPGSPVATFTGKVTKDEIVARVSAAKAGPCAGGKCGPGGCCPPKK